MPLNEKDDARLNDILLGVTKLVGYAESKAGSEYDKLKAEDTKKGAALIAAKQILEKISDSSDEDACYRGPWAREAIAAVDEGLGIKKVAPTE